MCPSAAAMMRPIICTVSTGYLPTAVSPDSITASAPSNTAPATSEASALVGVGLVIIDSSIWVATTTGLPTIRHSATIRFCQPGTSSGGNSTPRSPRATITPSDAVTISDSSASAAGFSIFDISAARPSIAALASITSRARCTKDSATQSTPQSSAKARSDLSFSVSGGLSRTRSGRLTPLRLLSGPPTSTAVVKLSSPMLFTRRTSLPSSISRRAPGCSAAKISGCGRPTRDALPISDERSKTKLSPAASTTPSSTGPTRCFGPCRSARIQTGCPVSSSSARMAPIRLACSPCVPCEKFRRNTLTPASSNARNASGVPLSVPMVATILVARGSAEGDMAPFSQ